MIAWIFTEACGRGKGRKNDTESGRHLSSNRTHIKSQKGKPTIIRVSGEEYTLRHKDQLRGRKGQKQIRRKRKYGSHR